MQASRSITAAHLAEAISAQLPEHLVVSALEPINRGHSGRPKFHARLSDEREAFVKVQPTPFAGAQLDALHEIDVQTAQGAPFNKVVCLFNDPESAVGVLATEWLDPSACFADRFLRTPGTPLPIRALERFGRDLCRLHRATSMTYRITDAELADIDRQTAWAVQAGAVDNLARERIDAARAYLTEHRTITTGLLHGDLHPGNLFMAGERIVAIDFEDGYWGATLRDLAILQAYTHGAPAIFEAVRQGYMDELGEVTPAVIELYRHTVSLVTLLFALRRARWGKPDWWY